MQAHKRPLLYGNLQVKYRYHYKAAQTTSKTTRAKAPLCTQIYRSKPDAKKKAAQATSKKQHVKTTILYGNLQEKCRYQKKKSGTSDTKKSGTSDAKKSGTSERLTLPANLFLETLLGNLFLEPLLGNLSLEPLLPFLGNLAWEPLLGNLAW